MLWGLYQRQGRSGKRNYRFEAGGWVRVESPGPVGEEILAIIMRLQIKKSHQGRRDAFCRVGGPCCTRIRSGLGENQAGESGGVREYGLRLADSVFIVKGAQRMSD